MIGRLVLQSNIHDFFNQGDLIARGHRSKVRIIRIKVCLGVEKKSGRIYAAKVVKKESSSEKKKVQIYFKNRNMCKMS